MGGKRQRQLTEDGGLHSGEIFSFLRIVTEVVELVGFERMILQDLPIASDQRMVVITEIFGTALAADEVKLAIRRREIFSAQDGSQAHRVGAGRHGGFRELHEGGENIEQQAGVGAA